MRPGRRGCIRFRPSVDVQMADGRWKRVINDMGFPAGLPRTIVVDLTGKLPPGARRIRITTNLQIYWDQALVDNGPDAATQIRRTEVPLAEAHLQFRGYPQQIEGKTPGDLTYNYNRISQTGPFFWARGVYTRYGDVKPLLQQADNRYVIFGTGEEIDTEFQAGRAAAAAFRVETGLLLLCERLCERHGFLGGFAVYGGAHAVPGDDAIPVSGERTLSGRRRRPTGTGLRGIHGMSPGRRDQRWDFNYQPAQQKPIQ